MRSVADLLAAAASTVPQQIAKLRKTWASAFIETDGRGVQLTPAGRRLASHATSILAAADAARLDPDAEPAGIVRVRHSRRDR